MTNEEPYANNYSDLHNPSVVSGSGAYSEYILPADNLNDFNLNWNNCSDYG